VVRLTWLALVGFGCFLCSPAAAPAQDASATKRIGLSLPLSGSSAFLAEQFRQGAELAVEKLAPDRIELILADDGCTTDLAELAAADLRAAGVLFVTGLLCNEAAIAEARIFRDAQVPLLVAGARSDRLVREAAREKWSVWRLAPSDHEAARTASTILSGRWAGKPWALIDDGTVGSRALADEFRARMEEANLPPVAAETYRPAQTTFNALIRRLERTGVTAAFVPGTAEDVAAVAAAGRENALGIEWVGGPELDALPFSAAAQKAPDGLYAILERDPSRLPEAQRLEAELIARGIQPEPYVFLGYAAASIAVAAVSWSVDEAREKLATTRFETVLGPVSFGADGASDFRPYGLFEWRGAAFQPAGGVTQ